MTTLKFSEIVERAHLSTWTSQYVLKHPDLVPGMPKAGSQGVHRVFDFAQAFRFALAALLVEAGIHLRDAQTVIEYCEKRERGLRADRPKNEPLFLGFGRQWRWSLHILDCRYLQIVASPQAQLRGTWYAVDAKKEVEEIDPPILATQIFLSQLVTALTEVRPAQE